MSIIADLNKLFKYGYEIIQDVYLAGIFRAVFEAVGIC
ncbi:MAG: hypothetical protein ACD_14C00026G0002 [uncultured bacterium]|nr:MAG: hypothetical protein ACD_14C00026G0002 [uncultured bacterium]